ncbi:MAG: glycosyltransferase, partial [Alphaproteobacteria bacterium]|nr:glycosyltransferase [Alphaproteobacteria bacterium]
AKLLLAAEKYAARQFTVSTFVSEPEAALFRKLAGSYGHTIHAVGNGVDAARFDPATSRRKPLGTHPNVVFTGAMDYRPNIDAVRWFAKEVWPMVRALHPDAGFIIVGSDPAPEVKKLASIAGIRVTGRVPEVQPYLLGADAVVAPLQLARGVQNKVLEAMAAARPVVATPQAFEGIDAVPGRHLLVADTPGLFASALDALFTHSEQADALGAAARAHILANYSWDAKLAKLDWLLTADIEELKAKRG